MHIHGISWGVGLESLIRETWKYGFIFIGQYVTEKTINYITKYMYKKDKKHPTFTGKVLCSAGIGSQYITRSDSKNEKGQYLNQTKIEKVSTYQEPSSVSKKELEPG